MGGVIQRCKHGTRTDDGSVCYRCSVDGTPTAFQATTAHAPAPQAQLTPESFRLPDIDYGASGLGGTDHGGVTRDARVMPEAQRAALNFAMPHPDLTQRATSDRPNTTRAVPEPGTNQTTRVPAFVEVDAELVELEKIVSSFLRIEIAAHARTLAYLQSRFGG